MNDFDSFEEKMRRQTFRSIPPEWKKSLLPTVPPPSPFFSLRHFWVSLIHPLRHAYALVAVVWVGIALLHYDTPDSAPKSMLAGAPRQATNAQIIAALQQRQQYLAWFRPPFTPENPIQ